MFLVIIHHIYSKSIRIYLATKHFVYRNMFLSSSFNTHVPPLSLMATHRFQIRFLALPWDFSLVENYSMVCMESVLMSFDLDLSCADVNGSLCILRTTGQGRPASYVCVKQPIVTSSTTKHQFCKYLVIIKVQSKKKNSHYIKTEFASVTTDNSLNNC